MTKECVNPRKEISSLRREVFLIPAGLQAQYFAILVERRITSDHVIDQLFNLFVFRGIPEYIRSDNGPEFTAKAIRKWLARMGVKTLFIEPGSPWENGYIESFNGKLRDELLNREVFYTLVEAKILIEQ
jgi:transposase InsO family protein